MDKFDIEEKTKAGIKNFIVGVLVMLSIGGVGAIATSLGLKAIPKTSLGNYGTAWHNLLPATILEMTFMFIVIGALILFWAKMSHYIGRLLHEKKELQEPTTVEQHQQAKRLRRLGLAPKFIFGIFCAVIITAVGQFASEVIGEDITTLSGIEKIFTSFTVAGIITIVAAVIAFGICGWIFTKLEREYKPIKNIVDDKDSKS